MIAVKPQDFEALLGEIGGVLTPEQTVLSVAAAIPTAAIERQIADGVPVVRAMPNRPATVHEGIAGICAGAHAGDEHLRLAEEALSHLGAVVEVPERYMDAVTAVSGSGPAYFALLAEAMIEAGILLGLSREVTTQLVVQTMLGTAHLLRDEGIHPVELREQVTSPGGTTIRAIRELERAGRARRVPERDSGGDGAIPRARGGRRVTLYGVELIRCADAEEVASVVADELVAGARSGQSLVLTGGSSPGRAYELAADREPDWSAASLWWGDERCVPPDDERSNFLLAREKLLDRIEAPPREVQRIRGELGPEEAAREYDELLREVRLDYVLLGIGPDGHTASLFPAQPSLEERERRAIPAKPTLEPLVERVTHDHPGALVGAGGRLHRHGREQGRRRRAGVRATGRSRDALEPDPIGHGPDARGRRRRRGGRIDLLDSSDRPVYTAAWPPPSPSPFWTS